MWSVCTICYHTCYFKNALIVLIALTQSDELLMWWLLTTLIKYQFNYWNYYFINMICSLWEQSIKDDQLETTEEVSTIIDKTLSKSKFLLLLSSNTQTVVNNNNQVIRLATRMFQTFKEVNQTSKLTSLITLKSRRLISWSEDSYAAVKDWISTFKNTVVIKITDDDNKILHMIKFYLESSFRMIWQQFASNARLNN